MKKAREGVAAVVRDDARKPGSLARRPKGPVAPVAQVQESALPGGVAGPVRAAEARADQISRLGPLGPLAPGGEVVGQRADHRDAAGPSGLGVLQLAVGVGAVDVEGAPHVAPAKGEGLLGPQLA